MHELGNVTVRLLCAKRKVAAMKKITLPRLELRGALTLSRLMIKVLDSLTIRIDCVFFSGRIQP